MSRYLTELADVARRTGYPVREVDGWRTRGHGKMVDKPQGVIAHHTASGSRSGDAPSLRIVRSGRSDLRGPLAQFVLGRDGTIHVVAAGLAWHAGATRERWQGNYYSVGIEAENNGVGEKWTDRQKAAYVALAAELLDEWGLPESRFMGHKEICVPRGRKIDPSNLSMDGMRRLVREYKPAFRGRLYRVRVPFVRVRSRPDGKVVTTRRRGQGIRIVDTVRVGKRTWGATPSGNYVNLSQLKES